MLSAVSPVDGVLSPHASLLGALLGIRRLLCGILGVLARILGLLLGGPPSDVTVASLFNRQRAISLGLTRARDRLLALALSHLRARYRLLGALLGIRRLLCGILGVLARILGLLLGGPPSDVTLASLFNRQRKQGTTRGRRRHKR